MEAATGAPAPAVAEGQPQGSQTEAAEPQGDEAGIGEWKSSIDQQLSQSNDQIRQLAEANQQFQQSIMERLPEPPAPPSFEDQFGEIFGDLNQTGGYLEPQQLQGLQTLMQDQIQQGIQQAVAPLMEEVGEFRQQMTSQQLQALQGRFPEMQDPQVLQQVADRVVDTAIQVAPRGMPPQMLEALTENPEFVALVHLAEKAKSAAREETPVGQGQPVPQIEQGGGAAPGSTAGGDEWDSFLQQRNKGSVW